MEKDKGLEIGVRSFFMFLAMVIGLVVLMFLPQNSVASFLVAFVVTFFATIVLQIIAAKILKATTRK